MKTIKSCIKMELEETLELMRKLGESKSEDTLKVLLRTYQQPYQINEYDQTVKMEIEKQLELLKN